MFEAQVAAPRQSFQFLEGAAGVILSYLCLMGVYHAWYMIDQDSSVQLGSRHDQAVQVPQSDRVHKYSGDSNTSQLYLI